MSVEGRTINQSIGMDGDMGEGGPAPTLNPKPGFGMEGIAKTNIWFLTW